MDYNYHTHTFRCRHASGKDEEYILRAIEGGIKYMGFSDHVPLRFSDGHETGYRVLTKDAEDYINSIRELREKYKDKIDIKIGFEMEYYPLYFKHMLSYVRSLGAEYLLLGQHIIYNEWPDGKSSWEPSAERERLHEYVSCIVSGIESGCFTYVAHPDIFIFLGEDSVYDEEVSLICRASRKFNIPLEINIQGLREERRYPFEPFWRIAAREKSPVTIGLDAHDPIWAYDGDSIAKAKDMIKELGLNYIGKPEIIPI